MKIIISFFICVLFSFNLFSQTEKGENYMEALKFLTSDVAAGRETGTKGELLSANFIVEKMKEFGLEPKGVEDSFLQEFTIEPKSNPHGQETKKKSKPITVRNVIGYMDNEAERTVVIGAHYDHLGKGAEGSLHVGEVEIHNGADDNASGVAILLQLAEDLKKKELYGEFNYLFIAFSGEEKGLWGSNYFCKNPTIYLENVNYMINMDMVGRFDKSKGLAINGVGTSSDWDAVIDESNTNELKLVLSESGVGPSDHTSFYLKDIPVLHFFTGQHEDYHKPTDDIEKINLQGMQFVNDMILKVIELTTKLERLEFTKTKDESTENPRFTVTLGVMPDYMFQGDGMRIDGVTEGKPASKAGFEAGDIVVKMGKIEVTDMMTYMEALSKFKKGDKTIVIVKRGEKESKEKVEF